MYTGILWDEIPILAIDTETTGFSENDRIVELGMVLLRGEEIIDEYQTFLDPGFSMPESASEVNHITDKDLRSAPKFNDVLPEVMEWLCRGAPWVAHNAPFDMRMLSYDLPPNKWPEGVPTLCTLEKAKTRGHRRAKLGNLAEHYGIEQTNAHRAVDDARVCGLIARKMTAGHHVLGYYTRYSEEWVKRVRAA
jgi:DNA polymerase III epsilon subunit family exonuclease